MSVQSQRRLEHGPRHWAEEANVPEQVGTSASRRLWVIALSILGLFLLYQIVSKGFSAYLADTNPEAALFLNGSNPTALLNLAEDKLSADKSFSLLDPVLAPPRNAGPGSTVAKGDETSSEELPAPSLPAAAGLIAYYA